MKRWIRGQELLDLGLLPFELLDAIRQRKLTPIDPVSGIKLVEEATLRSIPPQCVTRAEAEALVDKEYPEPILHQGASLADRAVYLYRKSIREHGIESLCSSKLEVPPGYKPVKITIDVVKIHVFSDKEVGAFLSSRIVTVHSVNTKESELQELRSSQEKPTEMYKATPMANSNMQKVAPQFTWKDVEIAYHDDLQSISVVADGTRTRFNHDTAKMQKKDGPSEPWKLLWRLGVHNGIISSTGIKKEVVSRLRKKLKELFPDIDGEIISFQNGRYRAEFRVNFIRQDVAQSELEKEIREEIFSLGRDD